jgi:hypothetical protein
VPSATVTLARCRACASVRVCDGACPARAHCGGSTFHQNLKSTAVGGPGGRGSPAGVPRVRTVRPCSTVAEAGNITSVRVSIIMPAFEIEVQTVNWATLVRRPRDAGAP